MLVCLKELTCVGVVVLELEFQRRGLALHLDFEMDLGTPAHVESMHSELLLLILQSDAWSGICLRLIDEELCVELILLAEDLVGLVNDLLHLLARLFHQVEIRICFQKLLAVLGVLDEPLLRREMIWLFGLLPLVDASQDVGTPPVAILGEIRDTVESCCGHIHLVCSAVSSYGWDTTKAADGRLLRESHGPMPPSFGRGP